MYFPNALFYRRGSSPPSKCRLVAVRRVVGAIAAGIAFPVAAVDASPTGVESGFASSSVGTAKPAPTAREATRPDTWHLQTSMMNVDASTRFVGSIVLNNPGSSAVYVRSSAEQVAIIDGERRRKVIPDGALRVYPEEFVLRPGDAFTARLVVDPSRIEGNGASYYVKFVDISNIRSDEPDTGRMQSAYLLGFEALVAVNKTPVPLLGATQFELRRKDQDSGYALKNLSGRHLYLDRGGFCPPSKPVLVECQTISDFPRQSLLPGETVHFSAPGMSAGPDDYVGFLVLAGLSQRDRPYVVYLPAPPSSSAASSAASRTP